MLGVENHVHMLSVNLMERDHLNMIIHLNSLNICCTKVGKSNRVYHRKLQVENLVRYHQAIQFHTLLGDIYLLELVLGGSFIADRDMPLYIFSTAKMHCTSIWSRTEGCVLVFTHWT